MLVLTRRVGEEIVIGEIIRVKIVAVSSQRVQVGISAPEQVSVHRQEVQQRLQDLHDCSGRADQKDNTVGLVK